MKITKILTGFLLILTFVMLTVTSPVKADDLSNGAKIFNLQCAGCHGGGGNIIRRGKTLKKKTSVQTPMSFLRNAAGGPDMH